ncbi:hypothetical protein [uncultured Desulfovibrio sp.]|uniref:phage head-tail joining protein n=1 Tax=uncultured Desulfovibrio sp. TaxID=167968 RepID=UPI002607D708|nr:hypothetical protein [uncultured Desulfovibrio sp.]
MTIEELQTMRDTLRAARYNGALTVRAGDKWVTYKSDKEMATALDALEREIAAKTGKRGKKRVLTYAEKGL